MFEIRCIVGDKKVTEILHLLDGHTLEPPVCVPVKGMEANGHAKEPKSRPHMTAPGGSINLLRTFIKGRKKVTSLELRQHLEERGYSKNGYSYALRTLADEGLLKQIKKEPGKTNTYEVLH